MISAYVIECFRWGALNDHHYIFDVCFGDVVEAIERAEKESVNRDHTYGVRVTMFTSTGDESVVAYFPSKCDEKEPYNNYKLEDVLSLGSSLLSLSKDSIKKLPPWLRKNIEAINDKKYE